MGKSLPSTARLYQVAKTTSQSLVTSPPKQTRPTSPTSQKSSKRPRLSKGKEMESESSSVNANSSSNEHRVPLSAVVSDCIKRWFKDTLKEAKAGDINMQVLVGQMYYNGYGVARDAHMGRVWITRASRTRSSAWKVGDKQPGLTSVFAISVIVIIVPIILALISYAFVWSSVSVAGYNASDSDSDELKVES